MGATVLSKEEREEKIVNNETNLQAQSELRFKAIKFDDVTQPKTMQSN